MQTAPYVLFPTVMTAPKPGRHAMGVFDSGGGGLAVLEALRRHMPHRDFVYVADTARAPYGDKSAGMVAGFAREIVGILCGLGVSGVVIASHTASAVALPEVAERCPIPVWGVIDPGVEAAARVTRTGHVGVIATRLAIDSGAYQQRLERRGFRVWARACPADAVEADLLARHGLEGRPEIDTLILGCTLDPLLRVATEHALGPSVTLVDSAEMTAEMVSAADAPPPRCFRPGRVVHYVTGDPAAFANRGQALRLPRNA